MRRWVVAAGAVLIAWAIVTVRGEFRRVDADLAREREEREAGERRLLAVMAHYRARLDAVDLAGGRPVVGAEARRAAIAELIRQMEGK